MGILWDGHLVGWASSPVPLHYNKTVMTQTIKPGYQPQAPDTSIEADVYFFSRLRQLSCTEHIALASAHNRGVRKLCLIGIKWQHKNASLEEIRERFVRAVFTK